MGYKAALYNRVPRVIDLALKWNNVKKAWVEHVYNNQIKIYKKNVDRKKATNIVLSKPFDFHKTIDWDNLIVNTDNLLLSKTYWLDIESWINWFTRNYAYIKNSYDISIESGTPLTEIKIKLKDGYLSSLDEKSQEQLVNFLLNSFKNE